MPGSVVDDDDGKERPCCISHGFFRSASKNSGRVAVVQSSGAVCRRSEELGEGSASLAGRGNHPFDSGDTPTSSCPPVYPGDVCFTCGDIFAAVESFSRRIRRVLDGEDDPDLFRPKDHSSRKPTDDMNSSPAGAFRMPKIVGVYIPPSVEYIVAVLAILRAGEAFLPLDPSWPEERILSVISSSKTALIVISAPFSLMHRNQQMDAVDWIVERSSCSALYLDMKKSSKEELYKFDLVWPCEDRNQRKFCYVMYTSGSTGKPKGVCGTEEGLLNRFWWLQGYIPLSTDDILLFKTSISFVDHLQEFLSASLTSTVLIIPPFSELKANPIYLIDFLQAYGVSRLTSVPSLMRLVLPSLRSSFFQIGSYLKVLVLSGEILSLSLWKTLHEILPETTILNLYGSTEVAGDCTFFDCRRLLKILQNESLSSVPIGNPISDCEIVLVGKSSRTDEGEIYVGGACLFVGYLDEILNSDLDSNGRASYFESGDFAKRLENGDLVFLGRKDRIVKVNGQRIALEEVESILMEHPEIGEAAVVPRGSYGTNTHLEAYFVKRTVLEKQDELQCSADEQHVAEDIITSTKSWLVQKLPPVMVPSYYHCLKSLPKSTSGKIDYLKLTSSAYMPKHHMIRYERNDSFDALLMIKEVFCHALLVQEVSDQDDFFVMGGNSISAAQAAHKLGIDMRLIYMFPSPSKLLEGLVDRRNSNEKFFHPIHSYNKRLKLNDNVTTSLNAPLWLTEPNSGDDGRNFPVKHSPSLHMTNLEESDTLPYTVSSSGEESFLSHTLLSTIPYDGSIWPPNIHMPKRCSFSRCNQFISELESEISNVRGLCLSIDAPRCTKGSLQELWKFFLKSCVDASPLVVFLDGEVFVLIGSHSHLFVCINALSGSKKWEVKLEDRIECSAAITGDFSQVVVGCYKGKIYFLDLLSGKTSWQFQTDGQVKMQPVVDKCRTLIWCGSYDYFLYAFDYKEHHCVYRVHCGGSIYGSPSINMVHNMILVASTSGRVTAISLEVLPFNVKWLYEAGAPIFGSLCLDSHSTNVICCLVDGHVLALSPKGVVVWKVIVGGPIFAGACVSSVLHDQVLICSKDGSIYSYNMEGALLWEYQVGEPIIASAFVDEQIQLTAETSQSCERLACVCSSSGSIHVIRIRVDANQGNLPAELPQNTMVQQFAAVNLSGDIFSSPVMIAGRIFVGCRDDYVRCILVMR